MKVALSLGFVVIIFLSLTIQAQTNLLSDPGFENDGQGWYRINGGGRSVVATEAYAGLKSQEMIVSNRWPRQVQQDVIVVPGNTYDASGWIKTNGVGGSGSKIIIIWINIYIPPGGNDPAPGEVIREDTLGAITGTQPWTQLTGSYTAPAGAVMARFYLSTDVDPDNSGTAWFDEHEFIGIAGTGPMGLVVYYKFDEGSGTTAFDSSGNGNDGTLMNNPTWTTGITGGALDFDGIDDYVDGVDIDFPSGPFTVSAWFKTTVTSGAGALIHKISNFQNQNYYIYPHTGRGGVLAGLWDGTGWQEVATDSNTTFNDGIWHHVAMVVSTTTIELFVDATSYGTVNHDNTIPTNDQNFNIGRQNNNAQYFTGQIDEVRIYNRTLSAQEVSTLYSPTQGILRFSAGSYSITEGNDSVAITVSRTGGSSGQVSVNYASSDDSARAGADYTAASGTITFADGDNADKTFYLHVLEDNEDEINETLFLSLNNPTGGAVLGLNTATLTIIDDDGSISDSGLVGFWKFEEASGNIAADSSGQGNNGILMNGPARVAGKVGQALDFDGQDDYVAIIANPALDNLNAVTMSAWIYPRVDSHWHVLDKGDGDKRLYAEGTNLTLDGRVRDNPTHAVAQSASNTVVLNTWQHVALTWSAADNTVRLYHNGVEVSYASQPVGSGNPLDDSSFPYTIGARGALGAATLFNGLIDEVRLYDRALNAQEISNIYSVATSIKRTFKMNSRLLISRNPLNSCITIYLPLTNSHTNLFIYDIKGSMVESFRNINEEKIVWNTERITEGIYVLKADIGKRKYSAKVMLQR